MHFTIVGRIRNAKVLAAGPSVRIRRHLVERFGIRRWRKMTGEATIRFEEEPGPAIMTRRGKPDEFAVCVHSDEDGVDLIVGKIYRVVKPKRNDRSADVRIIDESGEDYLYHRGWFVSVEVPLKVREALVAIR
jgi:hypothetical protein